MQRHILNCSSRESREVRFFAHMAGLLRKRVWRAKKAHNITRGYVVCLARQGGMGSFTSFFIGGRGRKRLENSQQLWKKGFRIADSGAKN